MIAGLILVALIVSAAGAGRWGRAWVAPLVASSVVWFLVNTRMEGPILWRLTLTHSLTTGDLAGLAGLALAAVVLVVDRS